MKISTLRALFEAGLTDEQISSVVSSGKDAGQNPESAKQKTEEKSEMQQLLEAVNGLKETIQASNIAGADNKEPETIDEILDSLILAD